MKQSKFSDSQIIEAIKRVEGGFPVPEICRELGISTATFYKWRSKYGGMDISMMAWISTPDSSRWVAKLWRRVWMPPSRPRPALSLAAQ